MTALIGREQQFDDIAHYLQKWLDEEESLCLFVNGVPGTGKTATVNEVVKKMQSSPAKKIRGKAMKRSLSKTVSQTDRSS
jgi:origin recognition complex subunit 1